MRPRTTRSPILNCFFIVFGVIVSITGGQIEGSAVLRPKGWHREKLVEEDL